MSEHSQGQNTAGHWAEEGCWNKQTILLLRFHSGSTFQVRDSDPGPLGCSASPSASVARVRLEQSRGGGSLTGCCRPEFLPASSTTTLFYTLTLCLSSTLLSNTIFCLSSSAICVKQHLTLLHTLLKQHIVPQAEHCASSTACRAPPVQVCVTHVHMIDIWPAGGGYQLYDNRNLIQKNIKIVFMCLLSSISTSPIGTLT